MKTEISRRAYAKRRNVTEAAIRKRIADGTLTKALTADGGINPDLADKLLAENTTGGNQLAGDLTAARARKAAASVALLRDEIEALEASTVPHALADEVCRRVSLVIAGRLLRIAPDFAAKVAGQPPATVATILDNAVFNALNEISETNPRALVFNEETKPSAKRPKGKALATMTLVQLTTLRTDLLARRLEAERKLKRREAVPMAQFVAQLSNRIMLVKTNVLSMHAKLATRFQKATPAKARAILKDELDRINSALACRAVSAAELQNALKTKQRKGIFQ